MSIGGFHATGISVMLAVLTLFGIWVTWMLLDKIGVLGLFSRFWNWVLEATGNAYHGGGHSNDPGYRP